MSITLLFFSTLLSSLVEKSVSFVPTSSISSWGKRTIITSTTTTTTRSPFEVEDNIGLLSPLALSSSSSEAEPAVSSSSSLPDIPEEWRGEVLRELSSVIDPDLNRDIVTLGFIKNLELESATRIVSFDVELTTPACPVKEVFQSQCEELVLALPWTRGTKVTMTAADPSQTQQGAGDGTPYGLAGVSSIIAVSSCKGGVGKSTTAVNLAYALQSMGATVGIFDADVYGPSLPTMIKPDDDNVRFVERQIAPLQRNGVRLMSFGYVNEGAAIMRGPMVTQLLDQFLSMVNWGQLDYLILDMPPGTGDIQLTLSQKLNITAAVIVTTPTELSFVDVARGVDMFQEVNVPCVAVVENMAYIEMEDNKETKDTIDYEKLKSSFVTKIESTMSPLDKDAVNSLADELVDILVMQQSSEKEDSKEEGKESEQLRIFGPGHKKRLTDQWGIEYTYSVPLLENIANSGDSGTPYLISNPDSAQADIYYDLASTVVMEVSKIKFSRNASRLSVNYNKESHQMEIQSGNSDVVETIHPADLRRECKCASCVEELTGRQLLIKEEVSDLVKPLKMSPCGNYALSVDWSDGHKSLYPFKQINSIIEESKKGAVEKEVQVN